MGNLIGLILPPFIDLINKKITDAKIKYLVALGVSILAGLLVNLDKLNVNDIPALLGSIALIATEAQAAYKLYWEKSPIREVVIGK